MSKPTALSTAPSDAPFTSRLTSLPVTLLLAFAILALSVTGKCVDGVFDAVATIPTRTIKQLHVWNIITGGFYEPNLVGAVLSAIGLFVGGQVLEPIWGSVPFLRFIVTVNTLACVLAFITVVFCFAITQHESFLTSHVTGFKGIIAALTVAIKQRFLDKPRRVYFYPRLSWNLSTNVLPMAYLLVSSVEEAILERDPEDVPVIFFGVWVAWVYLRFYQRIDGLPSRGDPRDEMSFDQFFFPSWLSPIVRPFSEMAFTVLHKSGLAPGMGPGAAGLRRQLLVPVGLTADGKDRPASDLAQKRRERGYQLLQLRLARQAHEEEAI